ncbi:MAG: hypothetical protein JO073_00670 [Actinobacteria bacterium]|nr:hypothetical protein [Actinomycetota bacterium]
MLKRLLTTLPIAAAALVLAPSTFAAGGHYGFQGGTSYEREQVVRALDASAFPWGVVPGKVTIHIAPGPSYATPGDIWLDSGLLDQGTMSWGIVQHEYAHQIDFLLLMPGQRSKLQHLLGGTRWLGGNEIGLSGSSAAHGSLSGERFASEVAWAYWPSPENVLRPTSSFSEAGHVPVAEFRHVLGSLLSRLLASHRH